LIRKCVANLAEGLRPILITLSERVRVAEALAENAGIDQRLDVFEIEQFIALNLYELGRFRAEGRRLAVRELVQKYVDRCETDPSLKIELKA
jgi:hypothetical protein